MTYINDQLEYDQILDMISSFQWLPDIACIRLAVDKDSEDQVSKSLNKFAYEMERQKHTKNLSGDHTKLILETLSHHSGLINARNSKEILAEAEQIVKTIGVGPSLIGVSNLYTTAYALTVRSVTPSRWNHFCDNVEKFKWQAAFVRNDTGTAISVGMQPKATMSSVRTDSHDSDHDIPTHHNATADLRTQHAEIGYQFPHNPKGGLASAFDNPEFKKKVDKLLSNEKEENIEAQHSVISGPESVPTRCSPFHQLLQEKYASTSSNKSGKKGSRGL
jgi:hypothetical protein